MAETWRGIYPITSFVLEALGRKRDSGRENALSEPEKLLLQAVEFWAAAAHGTLETYLQPDPAAKLLGALHAFEGIGAVRVASLVRVAAESFARRDGPRASTAEVIAQLDERLARTDDNVDDLIARYAGRIDDPAAHAVAL
jgi:hypothetical protein